MRQLMAFPSAYESISRRELPATCVLHDVAGSSHRQASSPCLLARLPPSLPGLKSPSPRLPGPGHACGQVISRTILALLLLDGLVVHMHVVLHGGLILVPQQLVQPLLVVDNSD